MIFRKYIPIHLVQFLKRSFLARVLMRKSLFNPVYGVCCEFTTRCNLRCKMCTHTYDEHLLLADMDFNLFKKIVEDVKALKDKKFFFVSNGLGEPLLYKDIIEAISYVKTEIPNTRFNLITNGLLLNQDISKSIIKIKTDMLTVSLNAPNSQIYKQMMGIDRYDQVVGNIINFLELRKQMGTKKPIVSIQIMETKESQSMMNGFYHFWRRYLSRHDKVFVTHVTSMAGAVEVEDYLIPDKKISRYPCSQCWVSIAIRLTGEVYPCCIGFNLTKERNDLLLGNIKQDSLDNIYFSHNSKVRNIKNCHLMDNYKTLPTCLKCDNYRLNPNAWLKNRFLPITNRKWI